MQWQDDGKLYTGMTEKSLLGWPELNTGMTGTLYGVDRILCSLMTESLYWDDQKLYTGMTENSMTGTSKLGWPELFTGMTGASYGVWYFKTYCARTSSWRKAIDLWLLPNQSMPYTDQIPEIDLKVSTYIWFANKYKYLGPRPSIFHEIHHRLGKLWQE